MEQVDQSDILIPRLGLCQSLSPQRRKDDKAFIEGLQEGQLFNTVTQEIYGSEVKVIPLFFFKNRIKYFDIEDGGGIDCTSANAIDGGRISPVGCSSCRFSTWGNGATDDEHGNDPPECTLYHNFMSFTFHSDPSPLAISYKATGLKLSKQLLAGVRLTRLPMYAKEYKVTVVEMREGKNLWYEKKLVPVGFVDQDLFKQMETNFAALREAKIAVDTTGEADDTAFPGGDSQTHTEL